MTELEIAARYVRGILSVWSFKDPEEREARDKLVSALDRSLNISQHIDLEIQKQAWKEACLVAGAEYKE